MADAGREAVKAGGWRCPKCGALIDHPRYRGRAINSGNIGRVDSTI
jgi:tRNA(Ile2) C34 agmatinyltransferase TiaS